MKRILVPVDFSDLSTDVIDIAGKIAKAFDGEVFILHVTVPGSFFNDDPPELPATTNPAIEEIIREDHDLKAVVNYLLEQKVKAKYELLHGPVVETILNQAEKFAADLIVVGSQSHGFLYRTFIGSVSDGVMRQSSCPVLVVPQP